MSKVYEELKTMLYPKSIALIGASSNPKKFGHEILKNMLSMPNNIKIYPINPKANEILGLKAYKKITDVPDEIDLAIVVVPAPFVESVVDEAIEKKVKSILIITGGFGELGEEGKRTEKRIAEKCRKNNMRLIGPNCVGYINMSLNLNASFIMTPPKGTISLVAQSGSFGASTIYEMLTQDLGVNFFINIGNMADVDFGDLIYFLADDENTSVIGLYIEAIKHGRKFVEALRYASAKKPVVVLKAGMTEAGARSAASHTGSLAGDSKIYETVLKYNGAFQVHDVPDFVTALKAYDMLPLPKNDKCVIYTNAGGTGVILTDLITTKGIKLKEIPPEQKEKLKEFLPPIAALGNPIDMIAAAAGKEYYQATKMFLEDDDAGILLPTCVVVTFLEMDPTDHARGIIKAWNESDKTKPVIATWLRGKVAQEGKRLMQDAGIAVYESPTETSIAVAALVYRHKYLQELKNKN